MMVNIGILVVRSVDGKKLVEQLFQSCCWSLSEFHSVPMLAF